MRTGDLLGRDSDQLFQVLQHLMKCQFMKFWYVSHCTNHSPASLHSLLIGLKNVNFEMGLHLCPHFLCTSNEGSDEPVRLHRLV